MPDQLPEDPEKLASFLSGLDLSKPDDLASLFALESQLGAIAGVADLPRPATASEPEEDPTPAYLAAADPTVSLEEFISIVGDDHGQTVNGQNLLFPACLTGSIEKVTWLLQQDVDVNHADPDGYTPLIYAALPGRQACHSILILLLERGAQPDRSSRYNETPLRVLLREGNYEGAALLVAAGADLTPFPAVHQAAANGDLDALRKRLSAKTIEERDGWQRTPWLTALHANEVDAARFLESQGADTSATGQTGDSALHLAAESNAVQSVRYLLDKGCELEARASFGNTPLHNAVESDAVDTARLLLEAGADIHALTESADAPISFADSIPMLELLHQHGADLNQVSGEGRSPLRNFAEGDDVEGLMWLLEHGARLNTLSDDLRTHIKQLLTS